MTPRRRPRRRRAPVLAFSGPSGVGKTTLLVKLLPALRARGLTVGALKHSGHEHAFDRPGKDSARLREAGAVAVAVQGPRELAYFGPPVGGLAALARVLPEVDVVIAEGFKGEPVPRVEVHRPEIEPAFLCARDPRVVAVVGEREPPRRLPWFRPGQVEDLAEFVARFALGERRARGRALASGPARGHRVDGKRNESQEHGMKRTTKTGGRTGTRRGPGSTRRGGATVREAGRKGGRRTLERRGPEFYSRIGRKGGKSSGGVRRSTSSRRGAKK